MIPRKILGLMFILFPLLISLILVADIVGWEIIINFMVVIGVGITLLMLPMIGFMLLEQ